MGYHQCTKPLWKDGYCKIHHPESVEKRQEEANKRYEEREKKSPWYRLGVAYDEIRELKATIRKLRTKLRKRR